MAAIRSFPFILILFVSTPSLAEEISPACFRLEGLTMSCAGGGGGTPCGETCEGSFPDIGNACRGKVIGTICEGKVKCYGKKCCDTCENTQANRCGKYTVCDGTPEMKECTGTQGPVDCSSITYCVKIREQSGVVAKSGQCIGSYDPGFQCDSPISAGDGCVCTCQRDEATKTCKGVSNGKCTKCECGSHETQNPNYINYCINNQTTCAVREPVPAEKYGECGCRCPDPGGSYGTPLCGGCSQEDNRCVVPPKVN